MIQDKNQDIIPILLALVAYIITTIWPDFNLVKQWNIIVKIVGLMQYILLKFFVWLQFYFVNYFFLIHQVFMPLYLDVAKWWFLKAWMVH